MSATEWEYSEKSYLQLVNTVFKQVATGNWVISAMRWMIDSKYRQYKRLDKFQAEQLVDPPEELLTIAIGFTDSNYDKRIVEILKWVHKKIRYKGDNGEKWNNAFDTLERGTDDCDGINNLIWVLARLSGIPAFKLYCAIGNTAKAYHYYLVYLAGGKLYAIDGTYYVNFQPINFRPKFKLTPSKYTSVDYVFNDKFCFRMR